MATTITAYLCADGAAAAIDFYAAAFGADEQYRMADANGRLSHAEIRIGETTLMLSDEAPELGVFSPTTLKGSSASFVLDVPDCDAVFERAIEAGARVDRPMRDEPYGRGGWLTDPFGHRWSVMTSNRDFDPSQMK